MNKFSYDLQRADRNEKAAASKHNQAYSKIRTSRVASNRNRTHKRKGTVGASSTMPFGQMDVGYDGGPQSYAEEDHEKRTVLFALPLQTGT